MRDESQKLDQRSVWKNLDILFGWNTTLDRGRDKKSFRSQRIIARSGNGERAPQTEGRAEEITILQTLCGMGHDIWKVFASDCWGYGKEE